MLPPLSVIFTPGLPFCRQVSYLGEPGLFLRAAENNVKKGLKPADQGWETQPQETTAGLGGWGVEGGRRVWSSFAFLLHPHSMLMAGSKASQACLCPENLRQTEFTPLSSRYGEVGGGGEVLSTELLMIKS